MRHVKVICGRRRRGILRRDVGNVTWFTFQTTKKYLDKSQDDMDDLLECQLYDAFYLCIQLLRILDSLRLHAAPP